MGVAAAAAAVALASFDFTGVRMKLTSARRVWALILIAIVGVLAYGSPAIGQDIPTLTADQPVSGQIGVDTFRQLYTFDAQQGASISVTLTVTAGSLDPQIILTDPQGAVIGRSLRTGLLNGKPIAVLQSTTLPATGTYFVIVTRFGQDRGTTTGSYSLRLTLSGGSASASDSTAISTVAAISNPANSTPAPTNTPIPTMTPITYGDQVIGTIDTNASRLYQFTAQRGDRVTITMQRIAGNLDSYLNLIDPAGKLLIGQDDDPLNPGSLDAAIRNILITVSGTYQIEATRFGQAAGTSRGSYALALSRLSADQLGLSAATAALLDPGMPVAGSIDATTPTHYYQIVANKGDLIGLDAIHTRGNLNPTVTLTDLSGKPIPSAVFTVQIGQRATLAPFALPATGSYLITISHAPDLITAGGYTLTLTTWQGTTVSPNGDLRVAIGTPINSMLSDAESSHEYVFSAKAGSMVTITMSATSGDLLPSLILETDTRRLLTFADPGQSGQLAQIKSYTLPGTGLYRIIATRHGRAGGTTSGDYTLRMSAG